MGMLNNSMLNPQNNPYRRALRLDGLWKFRPDPESIGMEQGWEDGLTDAQRIWVPEASGDLAAGEERLEYRGDFWYEKEIFVPMEWKGREVSLCFAGVSYRAFVFINGVRTGVCPGGGQLFQISITEAARYGMENRIVILGDNRKTEASPFPCACRSAWLTVVPRKFISFLRTSMERKNAAILVKYEAEISGKSADGGVLEIAAEVRGEKTGLVARATGKTGILQISPGGIRDLYHITAYLKDRDAILDEYRQEIVFDGL
ncbi:MAG: hypothetical protein LUF78_05360 [Clostridiales bacterium]|nr:hypothetical protein [Clostridiales bacterium]